MTRSFNPNEPKRFRINIEISEKKNILSQVRVWYTRLKPVPPKKVRMSTRAQLFAKKPTGGRTDGKDSDRRTDGRKDFGRTDGRTEKFRTDGKNSDGRKNFGRPFTPRTWLRSARNFGKTRFRWFAMFHFSTLNFFYESFFSKIFGVDFCFQECKVLEELWIFNPRWQMRRQNSLPELPLFLGRVPWRRGKRPNMCRHLWLGTKNDLTLWCDHNMIIW